MESSHGFNDLERAVCRAIVEADEDLSHQLGELLATAKVTSRDQTGHGFFTYFDTEFGTAPLQSPLKHVNGPNRWVQVDQAQVPMGFILWLANGRPDCIEGFQYATETGEIDLTTRDLSSLQLLGEWP